ncbi:hypothetical protein GKZ68_07295 [Hymenobacter sp. BRD128]|uniref:hypothetical protein n=1 Tax=Hymenobacter sp. BRD128 TaxID=2675878 RepID=UPI001564B561|nr:hypothetical protein [Hymenobacter sp. BRD128]QKG56455.1 hypothetical protein GKZ68_07295 [Hymenobacter sp. BRD128]
MHGHGPDELVLGVGFAVGGAGAGGGGRRGVGVTAGAGAGAWGGTRLSSWALRTPGSCCTRARVAESQASAAPLSQREVSSTCGRPLTARTWAR